MKKMYAVVPMMLVAFTVVAFSVRGTLRDAADTAEAVENSAIAVQEAVALVDSMDLDTLEVDTEALSDQATRIGGAIGSGLRAVLDSAGSGR